ncbi:MAG: ATP-binding protein [Allobaculum sp.]|nr:ATP-binding protein [Allobaculum sp.]
MPTVQKNKKIICQIKKIFVILPLQAAMRKPRSGVKRDGIFRKYLYSLKSTIESDYGEVMTDRQHADMLDSHIAQYGKENQFIEFKSNYQDAYRLGKYISALSNGATLNNEDYGYLYFGIDDDTLDIKGTSFDASFVMVTNKENAKSKQPLELFLRQYITPKINFSIKEINSNLD